MPARKNNEPASWELDADKPKPRGESRVRRSYCSKELVVRPARGVNTVHDIMLYAAREHGSKEAFGTRDVIEIFYDDPTSPNSPRSSSGATRPGAKRYASSVSSGSTGASSLTAASSSATGASSSTLTGTSARSASSSRPKEQYHLSPLRWMTYTEALQEVRDLGSGLRQLGAGAKGTKGFFGIYSPTSRNWMMMAQACAFNAVPLCTMYDTIPSQEVVEMLNETKVHTLFTTAQLLPNIEHIIAKAPSLRMIVYEGVAEASTLQAFSWCKDLRVVHLDDVRRAGMEHPHQAERAERDDVFCCMFTSGGGGGQKGVLLTHGNICSAIGSSSLLTNDMLPEQECFLAFLPQAHIMEFIVEMTNILVGVPIAYGRVKTLTDVGVRNCKSDIQEARPSMMIAVPQVWEVMRKGIMSKVDEKGALRKSVFNFAVKTKTTAMERNIPGLGGLTDVVFKQVKKQTGGRLRVLFNGGGTVAKSTQQFLSAALVQMIQGYGLTECTAMACLQHPSWPSTGAVGGPIPSAEIKLVDRPEEGLGYSTSANPPQGEIYIRGPAVFKGYYNRPDLDAAAFAKDGWFKTGDIGQWNKDGTLSIIDRVKNHVRLAGGYITIERLEAIYKYSPFVLNGCIIASPVHQRPCFIAVVNVDALFTFLAAHNVRPAEIDELCADPMVVDLCLQELNNTARKEGLKGHQLLEALVLTSCEWTPESGLLTAAQKLRRPVIQHHYRDAVSRVYTLPSDTPEAGYVGRFTSQVNVAATPAPVVSPPQSPTRLVSQEDAMGSREELFRSTPPPPRRPHMSPPQLRTRLSAPAVGANSPSSLRNHLPPHLDSMPEREAGPYTASASSPQASNAPHTPTSDVAYANDFSADFGAAPNFAASDLGGSDFGGESSWGAMSNLNLDGNRTVSSATSVSGLSGMTLSPKLGEVLDVGSVNEFVFPTPPDTPVLGLEKMDRSRTVSQSRLRI